MTNTRNIAAVRLLSVLLAFTLMLTLAACGGSNPPNETSSASTATASPGATAAPEESATATPEATQIAGAFTTYEVGDGYTVDIPNDMGLEILESRNNPEREFIIINNKDEWDIQISDMHDYPRGYDAHVDLLENAVSDVFEPFSFGSHSGYLMQRNEVIVVFFPYGNATGENEPFGWIRISSTRWEEGDDLKLLLSDPVIKAMLESITLV